MEEIKRCRKCGARLLEHEKRCPVCGTEVSMNEKVFEELVKVVNDEQQENDELVIEGEPDKNYWRSKSIWIVVIVLVVVTTLMKQFVANNPIRLKESNENNVSEKMDSKISIKKNTDEYSLATNINSLGISFVKDDSIYLMINGELLKYSNDFNSREQFLDESVTVFSEDANWYYYLNEDSDYVRMDKENRKEDILLKNVYYVHNLGDRIYYQNDSDEETIHCLELKSNEDHKISDEVSYSIIIDESQGRIFYINKSKELVSIALDGSDKKNLASNTNIYTYDGEFLYYINSEGLVKSNLEGESNLIYESSNLALVNTVNSRLIVQDKNTLYTMDLNGEDKKRLYTMDTGGELTFEVVGDKLLVLTKGSNEITISYEIVGLDGKRHILDSEEQPTIKGNEL